MQLITFKFQNLCQLFFINYSVFLIFYVIIVYRKLKIYVKQILIEYMLIVLQNYNKFSRVKILDSISDISMSDIRKSNKISAISMSDIRKSNKKISHCRPCAVN